MNRRRTDTIDETINVLTHSIEVLRESFGEETGGSAIAVICSDLNRINNLMVPVRHQGRQGKSPSCGTAMTISSFAQ